jgi:Ran GTPase-activating protein (RanGAP) involved in mRNA processing and transport
VKELDLSCNRIGLQGCENLSSFLYLHNSQLQVLNLEDNNLADKAALKLLEPLAQNTNLRVLNLSKNKLTDQVFYLWFF